VRKESCNGHHRAWFIGWTGGSLADAGQTCVEKLAAASVGLSMLLDVVHMLPVAF
jgi:hypothetical protein